MSKFTDNELPIMAFQLIERAEKEEWLHDLVLALYEDRSQNGRVAAFYQMYHSILKEQEKVVVSAKSEQVLRRRVSTRREE